MAIRLIVHRLLSRATFDLENAAMKKELFAELMKSMNQVLDHAQGKRALRTTILPSAPAPMTAKQVRELRETLNASQAVFAHFLNVSTRLVQAWEADRRQPDGAALRLLHIGVEAPEVVFAGLTARRSPTRRRRSEPSR